MTVALTGGFFEVLVVEAAESRADEHGKIEVKRYSRRDEILSRYGERR